MWVNFALRFSCCVASFCWCASFVAYNASFLHYFMTIRSSNFVFFASSAHHRFCVSYWTYGACLVALWVFPNYCIISISLNLYVYILFWHIAVSLCQSRDGCGLFVFTATFIILRRSLSFFLLISLFKFLSSLLLLCLILIKSIRYVFNNPRRQLFGSACWCGSETVAEVVLPWKSFYASTLATF